MRKNKNKIFTYPFCVVVMKECDNSFKEVIKQRFRVFWKAQKQAKEWGNLYNDKKYSIKIIGGDVNI